MGTFINFGNESLTFDAKVTEEYQEEAEVTESPVEKQGYITDHRQDRPLVLKVEGVISESPYEGQAQDLGEADVGGNRGLAALRYFRRSRSEIMTWVGTRFGVVSDLLVTEIQTEVPASQSTKFRLSLKQVKFAQASIVEIPPEFVPKKPDEPIKQCGQQATTDATDKANGEADGAASSILFNGDKTFDAGAIQNFSLSADSFLDAF